MMTQAERRNTCIHEAAHAVVFSLGGVLVSEVLVAEADVTSGTEQLAQWQRNGSVAGLCLTDDSLDIHSDFLTWDVENCVYCADRKQFAAYIRGIDAWAREAYR